MSNGEMINDKWTEIELLPEWEEEFYDVYTAKKHGKWLMLKTLKPQYRDLPEYQAMIEKEFDVRYNLIHPNIVIITDDVYGDSLRKLIDQKRVTPQIINQLRRQLVGALDYIQRNHIVHHPIRPETIIFTEIGGKLKLIDVGFDQRSHLTPADASEDICNYGKVLIEAIDSCEEKYPQLRRIAERCTNPDPRRRYRDVQELHLALEQKSGNRLYLLIILFLSLMILLLAWLNSPYRPTPPERYNETIETPATTDSTLYNQSHNGN